MLTVRMRRKGGDPLLMVKSGTDPPSVPRRSKIIADAWDQDSFDAEREHHSVTIKVPPHLEQVHIGIVNYSAHKRETTYYTLSTSVLVEPPPRPNCFVQSATQPSTAPTLGSSTPRSRGTPGGHSASKVLPRTPGQFAGETIDPAPRRVSFSSSAMPHPSDCGGAFVPGYDACISAVPPAIPPSTAASSTPRGAAARNSLIPRARGGASGKAGNEGSHFANGNQDSMANGRGGFHPASSASFASGDATIISSSTYLAGNQSKAVRLASGNPCKGGLHSSASGVAATPSVASRTVGSMGNGAGRKSIHVQQRPPPPLPAALSESAAPGYDGQSVAEAGPYGTVPGADDSGEFAARLELGYQRHASEQLNDEVSKLAYLLSKSEARRDAALDAADALASYGCRQRLLAHTFGRWVRAVPLRAARHAARRGYCEAYVLAAELEGVEVESVQAGDLAEAAQLHALSLKEQIGLMHGDTDGDRRSAERLRGQLEDQAAEVESLHAQLTEAQAQVEAAHAQADEAMARASAAARSGDPEDPLDPRAQRLEIRHTGDGPALSVVARELDALDSLSEEIARQVRSKRSSQAFTTGSALHEDRHDTASDVGRGLKPSTETGGPSAVQAFKWLLLEDQRAADAQWAEASAAAVRPPSDLVHDLQETALPEPSTAPRPNQWPRPVPEQMAKSRTASVDLSKPPADIPAVKLPPSEQLAEAEEKLMELEGEIASRRHRAAALHLASSPLSPPTPAERFGLGLGLGLRLGFGESPPADLGDEDREDGGHRGAATRSPRSQVAPHQTPGSKQARSPFHAAGAVSSGPGSRSWRAFGAGGAAWGS